MHHTIKILKILENIFTAGLWKLQSKDTRRIYSEGLYNKYSAYIFLNISSAKSGQTR